MTPEPSFSNEAELQTAIQLEVNSWLRLQGLDFAVPDGFGLDLAIFVQQDSRSFCAFLEVKAYFAQRSGGVPFWNGKGEGNQIEVLDQNQSASKAIDPCVRWVLGDVLKPHGSRRFAWFTNRRAIEATMGGLRRGKHHNLRVASFEDELLTWEELVQAIHEFVTPPK